MAPKRLLNRPRQHGCGSREVSSLSLKFRYKYIILEKLGHSVNKTSNPLRERENAMERTCYRCGIGDDERSIKKCVMCFRFYCQECETDRGGRSFCSKQCAELFFFGDEE